MSWHCSQALVEDFLEQGSSDFAQYARLSSIRTAGKSSFAAKKKATWNPFPCGTTSEHSMVEAGVTLWMSSLLGFLASHSASPAASEASTTPEICGPTLSESFAKYDLPSASWKTSSGSKQKSTSGRSWPIWPRSGMTSAGIAYELPTAAPPIAATGSGFWPTPTARDWKESGNEPAAQARKSPSMPAAVRMKEPVQSEEGVWCPGHWWIPLPTQKIGGLLNPAWVEWLMGWPTGWTALERLETAKFQQWLSAHGKS